MAWRRCYITRLASILTSLLPWFLPLTMMWAASWWNQQYGLCAQRTHISLGIWSESSLSARRKLGSFAINGAYSEDSDQTASLVWVFAGRKCHFVGFVMRRLNCNYYRAPGSHSVYIEAQEACESRIKWKYAQNSRTGTQGYGFNETSRHTPETGTKIVWTRKLYFVCDIIDIFLYVI